MALAERDSFGSQSESRNNRLTYPRCKRANDRQMRSVIRTRKPRLTAGADERDRALFAKLRNDVTCRTCGKRFDIPSHSLAFLQQGA